MRPGCDQDRPERLGIARKATERNSESEPRIWLHTGQTRRLKEQQRMRPTGVEPATFGLKDRRSLGPRKDPLTTELRALAGNITRAKGFEHCRWSLGSDDGS